jgi:hypothetical protein
MNPPSLQQLIPVLQLSVGPVILISGIGLLLLSMTNRFGRTIDRARSLEAARRSTADPEALARIEAQIDIIVRRAKLLRLAIIWASVSVLLAAILIIMLFSAALLGVNAAWMLALLFAGCLVAVIGSLVYFIRDLNTSLHALKLELGK